MGCGPKQGMRRRNSSKKHVTSLGANTTHVSSTLVMPRVPQKCTHCRGRIDQRLVKWIGPTNLECPYCGSVLEVSFEKIT